MKSDDDVLYFTSTDLHGKRVSLFDLANWKNGLAFKKIDFSKTGEPVIKIAELNNGITGTTAFTNKQYQPEVHLTKGDLVFSWSGNPQTSIDTHWYNLPDGWLNQHIFKVTPDESEVDKYYFFYVMKYLKPTFTAIAANKQTTGLGHVTIADLKRLSIIIPERELQKKIAGVLKALDDKIELNNAINKNLEQQAQATLKMFFSSKVANGIIGDILEEMPKSTIKVGAMKNCKGIFPFFTSGRAILRSDKFLVNGRNIFLNTGGIAGINIHIGEASYSTDTWCIRAENDLTDYLYLYLADMIEEINFSYFEGSALKHLQKKRIREKAIYIPNQNEITDFNALVAPMFNLISTNKFENYNLAQIRDSLLPKLMSGELDVSEINI